MAIRILSSESISGNITIHSPSNAPYIDFVENADTGDSKARITMDQIDTNNGQLIFSTENSGTLTNAVVIDNSQNVGIGNFTNPSDGNLVVKKDGLNTGIPNSLTSASFSESGGQLKGLTIGYRTDETTAVIAARTATGDIAFMGYNGAWLETARFTNDNRLGIGTDSPDSKLDVKGASATPADGNQTLSITNTTGGTQLNLGSAENSYGWIEAREGATLRNLLLNPNGGNIGIGTTTPIAPLHVVTPAVGGIDLTNISRTANNLVRFTNPEYSTSATMGLLLRVFPDSDARQGAGLLMTGGSDNAASNLTLFVSKDDGTSSNVSQSYSALHIAGNTGNVGIGVTSPGAKLEVDGSTNAIIKMNSTAGTGGRMDFVHAGSIYGNIGSARNILGTGNAADMMINADSLLILGVGSQDMTILPSGNVGIGTTSPDGKLEVAGGTTLGLRLSNTGDSSAYDQVRMTYGGYNSGAPTVTFMPLTTPGGGNVDTTFHFMNTNGLNANNNRANVNIDGILNVGSGRQSGETTLIMRNYDDTLVAAGSIQNSIRMSGRYWSGSASQLVETRINSVHQESNGNGGSALTFWTQTGGDAATEQVRIDKIGNVGINTNDPPAKLSVYAGGADGIQLLDISDANNSGRVFYARTNGGSWCVMNNATNYSIRSGGVPGSTSGTEKIRLTGYSATSWTAGSDETIKENIKPIGDVLDKIDDYRCIEYNLIDDETKDKKIGFIAQDWQEDFPQIVEQMEDEKIGMKYTETIPVLLKAIQELKAEIELLKNK